MGYYQQDKILAFRDLYTGNSLHHMKGLLEKVLGNNLSKTSLKYLKKERNYHLAVELLSEFLQGIDPEKHYVYGLQCYFPKDMKITAVIKE